MPPENSAPIGDTNQPPDINTPQPGDGLVDAGSIINPSQSVTNEQPSTDAVNQPVIEPVLETPYVAPVVSNDITPPTMESVPPPQPNTDSVPPLPPPISPVLTPQANPAEATQTPSTGLTDAAPLVPKAATPTNLTTPAARPKKRLIIKLVIIVIALVFLASSLLTAYYLGRRSVVVTPVVTAKPIDLPSEAIVTAECTPGRGKQYIIPKDIPAGPIYDVHNGKVIAIEYLVSMKALLSNADAFTDTMSLLMNNYKVDHFTIVPTPANSGDTDQYFHLIMFVVSKSESNSIACGTSSDTGNTNDTQETPTAQ